MLRIAPCTQLSCSVAGLSRPFHSRCILQRRGPTTPPPPERGRFGLLPGRSPLLGESLLFSLPPGTKMFQFPGFASTINVDGSPSDCRVAPFGHLRVTGRLHLTGAFRSLPRPSSPSRAQASAVRPSFLSPRCACTSIIYRHAHAMDLPLFVLIVLACTFVFCCRLLQQEGVNASRFRFFCSSMSMNGRGNAPIMWRITDSNR